MNIEKKNKKTRIPKECSLFSPKEVHRFRTFPWELKNGQWTMDKIPLEIVVYDNFPVTQYFKVSARTTTVGPLKHCFVKNNGNIGAFLTWINSFTIRTFTEQIRTFFGEKNCTNRTFLEKKSVRYNPYIKKKSVQFLKYVKTVHLRKIKPCLKKHIKIQFVFFNFSFIVLSKLGWECEEKQVN